MLILIPVLSLEYAGPFASQRFYTDFFEIYYSFLDWDAVRQFLPFKRARASGPPLARLLLPLAS